MGNTKSDTLVDWCRQEVRPFLEQHAPTAVAGLEQRASRLEQLAAAPLEEASVCFLGAAGVGKSTLLNALVSERHDVVPHGGVGPLTAQATIVRDAEEPYFHATYLPPSAVNRMLFALERTYERTLKEAPDPRATEEIARKLSEEERHEAEADIPIDLDAPAEGGTGKDKIEAYRRQVRLLVQGDQAGEIDQPYLMDALRVVLGYKPRWGRTPTAADALRIARIRECLALAQGDGVHRERLATGDLPAFLDDLGEHASKFLAPLLKRLVVGWNAEVLREGITLVDLPGVGIANDEYRDVTAQWIREKARAVALVVDHRGVPESTVDLLRTTGFLNRLLHDSHDPAADPVTLAVIVVKVDDAADAGWRHEKTLHPGAARKWAEHFQENCAKAIDLVQRQVQQELDKLANDGPLETRPERQAAVARMLASLQIHPVSAPQYRLFHAKEEDDPARIRNADESRIPSLIEGLRAIARAHRARGRERTSAARDDLQRHASTTLELVRAQWEADGRAEEEAEVLRGELQVFLAPKQREMDLRQGAFREFLREGVPKEIELRVAEAAQIGRAEIGKYLRALGSLHWATLRATVRRGGAHVNNAGLHVNLPNELALRFEEPIAVVWSKHILTSLRRRTAALGGDYVALVAEVVEWARAQKARVQPRVVEALHGSLVAQTKDLSSVGKEAVDELKRKVRDQLYGRLVHKIRQRCERFVEQKKHEGPGVKVRILELFHDQLATDVVEIAQPLATDVLLGNYGAVQHEISERFAAYQNPLDAARDSIVRSHEEGVRRSDAQRRRGVLERLDAIFSAMPGDAA